MLDNMKLDGVSNLTLTTKDAARESAPYWSFSRWDDREKQLKWSLYYVNNIPSNHATFSPGNSVNQSDIQRLALQKSLIYVRQPGGNREKRQLPALSPSREEKIIARPAAHRHRHDIEGTVENKAVIPDPCLLTANRIKNVQTKKMDIDTPLFLGRTLLIKAAMSGCIHDVTELLTAGANHHAIALHDNKRTALIYAARNGHGAVVDKLLTFYEAAGDIAGIRYADSMGMSALMYAVKKHHQQITDRLFLAGQHVVDKTKFYANAALSAFPLRNDVNEPRRRRKKTQHPPDIALAIQDSRRKKAPEPKSRHNPTTTIRKLMDTMAHLGTSDAPITVNVLTNIAIIDAAKNDDISSIDALLAQGADIDAVDEEGKTALIWAATRGALQIVEVLLERGANTTIRDQNNKSALHYAIEQGHTPVEGLILQYIPSNAASATPSGILAEGISGRWLSRLAGIGVVMYNRFFRGDEKTELDTI